VKRRPRPTLTEHQQRALARLVRHRGAFPVARPRIYRFRGAAPFVTPPVIARLVELGLATRRDGGRVVSTRLGRALLGELRATAQQDPRTATLPLDAHHG
jgi:ribosomal protein S19E (S16A)